MSESHSDKLVLIVEDDESIRKSILAWLRNSVHGFAVMSANNGKLALAQIQRHRPDLIVSDVRMPEMDGLELLLQCRRSFPEIRFILMSAFGDDKLEQESRQRGAIRFLHKPLDLAQLDSIIAELLSQEQACAKDGFLHGISIPGFVQLLNLEKQSLLLQVTRPDGTRGSLAFRRGELVHAVVGEKSGEAAAYDILAWQEADLVIDRDARPARYTIETSLPALIMEAMRLQDEHGK